jgi:hypothetical protein
MHSHRHHRGTASIARRDLVAARAKAQFVPGCCTRSTPRGHTRPAAPDVIVASQPTVRCARPRRDRRRAGRHRSICSRRPATSHSLGALRAARWATPELWMDGLGPAAMARELWLPQAPSPGFPRQAMILRSPLGERRANPESLAQVPARSPIALQTGSGRRGPCAKPTLLARAEGQLPGAAAG